ncbi:RNA polymerase sigma factor [Bhargavaea beijingensis]
MKLIKEKKSSALEEIYDRYIKLIYGFTFKFMNGNEESTKEVVQLVFLRLWTTKSGYDSEKGSFVNWILTINRNICIDYIRKERIHREKQINMMNPSPQESSAVSDEAAAGLLQDELSAAKSRLSSAQYRLIHLLYWQGYSLTEIAQIENEPVGTIKSRLHQSLKRLKRHLELGER